MDFCNSCNSIEVPSDVGNHHNPIKSKCFNMKGTLIQI